MAGKKAMDRLVFQFRRFRRRAGGEVTVYSRRYRYCVGDFGVSKADTACSAMDGVLGILDGFTASDSGRANLGLCGALGKLGSAVSPASFAWMAEVAERVDWEATKCLSE